MYLFNECVEHVVKFRLYVISFCIFDKSYQEVEGTEWVELQATRLPNQETLHLNMYRHGTTGYFLRTPQDYYQLCFLAAKPDGIYIYIHTYRYIDIYIVFVSNQSTSTAL